MPAQSLPRLEAGVQGGRDLTIRRAGLRAHVLLADGLTQYRIPVSKLADKGEKRRNKPVMGEVTTPLVALLHERRELREVYPPADFIDHAVRGGA